MRADPLSLLVRGVAVVAALGFVAAGCGDDDDAADAGTTASAPESADAGETTGSDAPDGNTVTVDAVDYAFEGLPDSVPAGTEILLDNSSDEEAHELVAVLLPDGEERSIDEILALPEEELDAQFGDGPPALVTVAGPGASGSAVVGDGTLTEPGRYAVFCAIPTGADPEAYLNPEGDGPPDVEGGPPHFVNGMLAELRVDG